MATQTASPDKRRVLASLDVNTPPRGLNVSKTLDLKEAASVKVMMDATMSREPVPETRKRMSPDADSQPCKRVCVDDMVDRDCRADPRDVEPLSQSTTRQSSASPAPSSVFDNSAIDTSQATTAMTEPDMDAGDRPVLQAVRLPPSARPRYTQQEVRQKAEILRLRLGLANYKLRTGQTDVPLEQLELQLRPKPRDPRSVYRWQQQQQGAYVAGDFGQRRPLPSAPVRSISGHGHPAPGVVGESWGGAASSAAPA